MQSLETKGVLLVSTRALNELLKDLAKGDKESTNLCGSLLIGILIVVDGQSTVEKGRLQSMRSMKASKATIAQAFRLKTKSAKIV
eukprot:11749526-Karenia_brevis.AAC.1